MTTELDSPELKLDQCLCADESNLLSWTMWLAEVLHGDKC